MFLIPLMAFWSYGGYLYKENVSIVFLCKLIYWSWCVYPKATYDDSPKLSKRLSQPTQVPHHDWLQTWGRGHFSETERCPTFVWVKVSNPNFPWYDPIPLWPTPPNGSCSMLWVKEINLMMNMIRILIQLKRSTTKCTYHFGIFAKIEVKTKYDHAKAHKW